VDRDGTHSWRVECQADEKGADHFCAVGPERREKADAIAAWNAVAATRVAGRVAAAAEAIIDAAIGWRAALAEGRNADAGGHWWTLCSLAERAEAAERVAQAADALGWTDAAAWMEGADEFKAALEAWRGVDRG